MEKRIKELLIKSFSEKGDDTALMSKCGKSFTGKQLVEELTNETQEGMRIYESIISLSVGLLKRGVEKVDITPLNRYHFEQFGWYSEPKDYINHFPHKAILTKPLNPEMLEDGEYWEALLSLSIRDNIYGEYPWIRVYKHDVHSKDEKYTDEIRKDVIFEGKVETVSEFEKLMEYLQIN